MKNKIILQTQGHVEKNTKLEFPLCYIFSGSIHKKTFDNKINSHLIYNKMIEGFELINIKSDLIF
jgi:hypothetical protein